MCINFHNVIRLPNYPISHLSFRFVDCIGGAEKVLDKSPSNAEGSGRKIGSVSDDVNVTHLVGIFVFKSFNHYNL